MIFNKVKNPDNNVGHNFPDKLSFKKKCPEGDMKW